MKNPSIHLLILFLSWAVQATAQQPARTAQPIVLDVPALRRALAAPASAGSAARLAQRPAPTYRVALPTLHGSRPFVLTETFVLPATDAAARQRLRTFVGYEASNPAHHLALTLTPQQLTAHLLAGEESASLRPAAGGGSGYVLAPAAPSQGPCGARALPGSQQRVASSSTQPSPFSFGTQLRRIRYAIAVTPEYYAANGNADAAVEQAVATAMNQMTALYLSELAVSFELARPTGSTYYFAAAGQLGYQNLGNVGGFIGSSFASGSYDLGHCLHDSGGGVAFQGVVCNTFNNYRAQAWSGVTPWGFQQTLAHEMGHQLGAGHTFGGNCGGYSDGSNLEPGGGATIMAYTYVCGNQNLWDTGNGQADHFNLRSLDEMRLHLQGVGCPALTTNANRPPTVSAGPDYIIPTGTPFTLTANGTDPDGDQLAYTWNQFDYTTTNRFALGYTAGTAGRAAVDDPEAPLFRPRPPRTTPSRTFPDLNYILYDRNLPNDRVGEALPNVARDLHFVVTARDRRATGGTLSTDNVTVTVAPTGPFAVTTQNATPALWVIGQAAAVTWAVGGTSQAPISAAQVRLTLSTDGGQTFATVLAASVPNTGAATVTVPNLPTTRARIRVEAVGNIFFDINDVDFPIATCQPVASQTLPATALSANVGDAALNLNQQAYSLTELTGANQLAGTISGTDPTSTLSDYYGSGCVNYSNVTYYDNYVFVPSTTDTYTIDTPTGFGNMVLRLYSSAGFDPGNPCANVLADNVVNAFLPRNIMVSLTAGQAYTLVVSSYDGSLPANGAYRVTFASQSGQGTAYAPLLRAGYDYQYAVVNVGSGQVVQVAPTADLRALPPGTYDVYGLVFQAGYTTSGLAPRSLSSLQAALGAATPCGQLSRNARRVSIMGQPLPVVLTRFTGRLAGAANELSWQTASEAQVSYFEVQRSLDGQAFAALGQRPATNRSTGASYTLPDTAPPAALAYYRLRVVEANGTATYSAPLALHHTAAAPAALLVAASPNPVPAGTPLTLHLHAPQAQPAQLRVTDALGRLVLRRELALPAGPTQLALPEARQWHGLYVLSVQTSTGERQQQKLVLE